MRLGRKAWAIAPVGALIVGLLAWHSFTAAATGLPPLPADAQSGRVLPRVTTLLQGEYAFELLHPDGSPVVPDPCRPLHWTFNPDSAPPGAEQEVREAVDFVSAATGLKFVEDAPTNEAPGLSRASVQKQRYGDRWAPVLVAFSSAAQIAALGGDVAAVTVPVPISTTGPASERLVTGQIVVDTDFTRRARSTADGRSRLRMVLMHELGHLVGLDHVRDPSEVMAPVAAGFLYFGAGDQEGLAQAGSGRCFTDA